MNRSGLVFATALVSIVTGARIARADSVSYTNVSASAALTVTNGGVTLSAETNGEQQLLIFNPPNGVGVLGGNANVEFGEWLTLDFDGFLATDVVLQITPEIPIGPTILVAGFGVGGKPLGQFNAGAIDFAQVSLLFQNQPLSKIRVSTPAPLQFNNFAVAGISFKHSFDEASVFLPGQKLHGYLAGFGDVREIAFVGQAGAELRLRCTSVETDARVRIQLVTPLFEEESSRVEAFSPTPSDAVLPMDANVLYVLRFEAISNEPGEFSIDTLVKLANEQPLGTLKGKKGGPPQDFAFVAFAGCAVDGTIVPNSKVKQPIVVELFDPTGAAVNLAPFVTTLNQKGAQLAPMPIAVAGTYRLRVSGLTSTKAKAAVKLNIKAPDAALGDAILR